MTARDPIPPELTAAFRDHLQWQLERYHQALECCGHDALVIAAGKPRQHFLDDIDSSWKANPHFRLFVPEETLAGSYLVLRQGQPPTLLQFCPADFWHLPPSPVSGSWCEHFALEVYESEAALDQALKQALAACQRPAWLDPQRPLPSPALMARLDFARARKTAYEVACMRAANTRAARGHRAARDGFLAGASEFEMHLAYLRASEQLDADLPYDNIIGVNEHGAVLHYQHRERARPAAARSLLIDAGATCRGYAADVTRTHTAATGAFGELIDALDAAQQRLVAAVRPDTAFVALHEQAHREVAAILIDHGLAAGSTEALLAEGVTRAFLPHGLGHLIGLQTHDVGGQLAGPEGGLAPPPSEFPALRLTRTLEPGCVVTIEPGLYFIPMLLKDLRAGSAAHLIHWDRVESFLPWGGIRIEDNIHVTATGNENLTRPALAAEGLA